MFTRNQALNISIGILEKLKDQNDLPSDLLQDVINNLQDIKNSMPVVPKWSKGDIFNAINEFILVHNRLPTNKDFYSFNNLPHISTLLTIFNMTYKDFLKKYYPESKQLKEEKERKKHTGYLNHSIEYWTNKFKEELIRINPTSENDFNRRRANDCITWQKIAELNGLPKYGWYDLLEHCGLKEYYLNKKEETKYNKSHTEFSLNTTHPVNVKKLNAEKEYQKSIEKRNQAIEKLLKDYEEKNNKVLYLGYIYDHKSMKHMIKKDGKWVYKNT